MKNITYITLLFVIYATEEIHSQTIQTADSSLGVYPLQVGNVWQYWTYDYLNGQTTWFYGWTDKVISDTIMINSMKYSVINSDKPFAKNIFLRQELNQVFQFVGKNDSLIYDYNKHTGDTLLVIPGGLEDTLFQVIKNEQTANYFGQERKIWTYYMFFSKITYYESKDIVDGIGQGYLIREGGDEWFLRGAIINGVKYGNITSIKSNDRYKQPTKFELYQNYPNPFNPTTTISYQLPAKNVVTLKIFDLLGREIATLVNEQQEAGTYSIQWNASHFSSGIYVAVMRAGKFTATKKLLLMK